MGQPSVSSYSENPPKSADNGASELEMLRDPRQSAACLLACLLILSPISLSASDRPDITLLFGKFVP